MLIVFTAFKMGSVRAVITGDIEDLVLVTSAAREDFFFFFFLEDISQW